EAQARSRIGTEADEEIVLQMLAKLTHHVKHDGAGYRKTAPLHPRMLLGDRNEAQAALARCHVTLTRGPIEVWPAVHARYQHSRTAALREAVERAAPGLHREVAVVEQRPDPPPRRTGASGLLRLSRCVHGDHSDEGKKALPDALQADQRHGRQ